MIIVLYATPGLPGAGISVAIVPSIEWTYPIISVALKNDFWPGAADEVAYYDEDEAKAEGVVNVVGNVGLAYSEAEPRTEAANGANRPRRGAANEETNRRSIRFFWTVCILFFRKI